MRSNEVLKHNLCSKPKKRERCCTFSYLYIPLFCTIAIVVFERLRIKLKLTYLSIIESRMQTNDENKILQQLCLHSLNDIPITTHSAKKINAKHNCSTQPSTCVSN